MNEVKEEDVRLQRARKRVEEIKGFYVHLTVYLVVNLGLFLINLISDSGNWWFLWPLLGWGVALAIHGAVVFGVEGPFGQAWEERKVRELMERDKDVGRALSRLSASRLNQSAPAEVSTEPRPVMLTFSQIELGKNIFRCEIDTYPTTAQRRLGAPTFKMKTTN
jgi:2TM domain